METLSPGIFAEEKKDRATISMVFWPKTGMVLFIFFFLIYLYLMYGFTPKGQYAHTFRLGEAILFYLMFLGLFSPMLYLAITMWLNRTIIEITRDRLVMRYRLPYWFRKKVMLGPGVTGFRFQQSEYTIKGMKKYLFSLMIIENGKETPFTDFYFQEEGIAVTEFLNKNLHRLRSSGNSGLGVQKHDG